MKTKRAIAQRRDDGGVGARHARGKRKRYRAANGTGNAVDDARLGLQAGLRPLADLAAVGNKNGIVGRIQQRLRGAA